MQLFGRWLLFPVSESQQKAPAKGRKKCSQQFADTIYFIFNLEAPEKEMTVFLIDTPTTLLLILYLAAVNYC